MTDILLLKFYSIFLGAYKLAKISVSNINQVLSSLKTYQANLYFSKLPGITYISINYRKGLYSIYAKSIDLDILHEYFSSLFAELYRSKLYKYFKISRERPRARSDQFFLSLFSIFGRLNLDLTIMDLIL